MNFKKLHEKVLGLSTFKLFLLMFALILITQIIMIPLHEMFPLEGANNVGTILNYSSIGKILAKIIDYCVITSFINTIIFQVLITRTLWRLLFKNDNFNTILTSITISGAIFAMLHGPSYMFNTYIISNFILGVILAYAYIVFYTTERMPVFYTTCLQSAFYGFFIVLEMIVYL